MSQVSFNPVAKMEGRKYNFRMEGAPIRVIFGSKSDLHEFGPALEAARQAGVPFDVSVYSAHRQLAELQRFLVSLKGTRVIIAVAGLSAALPGVVAALVDLPVIGVPRPTGPLRGVDAVLSMLQMPKGVPVATMGLGETGLMNAFVLALRILGLADPQAAEYRRKYESLVRGEDQESH